MYIYKVKTQKYHTHNLLYWENLVFGFWRAWRSYGHLETPICTY